MFRMDGRTALVTGAATGLGQAIALAFAQNGADVAISDKPAEDLSQTENLIGLSGRRLLKVPMDVREISQIEDGVRSVESAFGSIDILVNNAGINRPVAATSRK